MATAAQVRATTKYIKEHTRSYTIRCNNETDADIIEFLGAKDNVTAYIKGLIKREIANEQQAG